MTYSLTRYIKDKATEIGFEKIGITKATATKDEKVKKLPYGVFFGFTENEENLLKTHENY